MRAAWFGALLVAHNACEEQLGINPLTHPWPEPVITTA
jgi:hypothetical protein